MGILDPPYLTSSGVDAKNAALVNNAASATTTALKAAYASRYSTAATAAATARLLSKLQRNVEDAVVLYIGDSTGNDTIEHVYLEFQTLASKFPAYTVTYMPPGVDDLGSYGTAITLQTGSGSRTLTIYNASYAGTNTGYFIGSRWTNAFEAIPEPDLVFVSHGHNMGDPSSANGTMAIRNSYLSLTEEISILYPKAGIVLEAQNPTFVSGRETWQAIKAQILQRICSQRGYGFIDIHQAFMDTGAASTYVKTDLVHPTTSADSPAPNGSALWATVVGAALTSAATAAVPPQQPSALTQGATSLLPNQTFSQWTGATPDGWAAVGDATISKDTTNYETGTWGMAVTAGTTTGIAYAEYAATPAALGISGRITGRVITVAVRVLVPSSYSGIPSLVVKDQTGSANQARNDVASTSRGRFMWLITTKRMNNPLTSIVIQVAARLSGVQAGSITVDRISVVEGDMPRDGVTGTPGPKGDTGAAGAAGTGAVGLPDYLSTFGNSPGIGLSAFAGGIGVQTANGANLYRIKPGRNVTAAILSWVVHTASGNYDIGLYAIDGTRLWSKGSTAVPATGAVTETISPTVSLIAGTEYWIAITFDNTTAFGRGLAASSGEPLRSLTGAYAAVQIGSSFPLPATITPGSTLCNRFILVAVRES